ncbi:MAG: DUF4115 domain-containing protein [Tepidimonas sp.]|uniref:helix-turn-helix domain-containing protein n=1 Tax=Tepidimonas sp. TaxID=2002775 RepID=UPI00259F5516|nr:helix-turn-helix domain-containing protein [Tepidimonas sp.]MDM7455997.1 DUF4115 domain-containing protein [Tepidimonas sp.]
MSESGTTAPATQPQSAGEALRQARERAGLHIAAIAATLKVPVERLEALEADRYDALPDVTFVRALALSVCRLLKIDPAPILAALPAGQAPQLGATHGSIDAPMPRENAAPDFGGSEASGRRAPLWIALALAVLAGVLWFVLPSAGDTPASPAAAGAEGGTAPAAGLEPGPKESAANSPAAAMPPAAEASSADAPAPLQPASEGHAASAVQLRARAESWIQVIGASGRVWLQRNLQPGEDVRFDEDLPLAITVGRADATEVVVRGQPFDLGPMTRNNVARFEIR